MTGKDTPHAGRRDDAETPAMGDEALAELLRGASCGDQEAWRRLVGMYGRRVFALARSRCRNREVAEDITQSVFATVAAKLGGGEYLEQGRFEAWLFRVAMNRVRDHVRQVRRRPELAGGETVDGLLARDDPGEARSGLGEEAGRELESLREALGKLSDADREIIELRHHGGMSFKDMAEVLDEPLGTLLARHHRALRKLREMMEPREVRGEVVG